MRPERLEVVGFAPFRASAEVDFSDLEMFALTGPTGAGKSSVIDAITFALYGTVARYDNKTAVEPVISLGAAEARVRFDFTLCGTAYTVVRVARRRPKGGATIAEARLESAGEVLASGGPDVTRAVEGLFGLSFDHFTRSVVLPQGDFAEFLHDTPARQQDLVKALLDMGVLDSVRTAANERAKTADALATAARQHIDQLADATEEAVLVASRRVATLEGLVAPVATAEEAVAAARLAATEHGQAAADLGRQAASLAKVTPPEGTRALASALSEGRQRLAAAEKAALETAQAVTAAIESAADLPTTERLVFTADLVRKLGEAEAALAGLDPAVSNQAVERAQAVEAEASTTHQAAVAALEAARIEHAAHDLVAGLEVGDLCPVCRRPLEELPAPGPGELEAARAHEQTARDQLAAATRATEGARLAKVETDAKRQAIADSMLALQSDLAEVPFADRLDEMVEARRLVDERLAAARAADVASQAGVEAAKRQITESEAAEKAAWSRLEAVRDGVALLGPPPVDRTDLTTAWDELEGWAEAEGKRLTDAIDEATAAAAAAKEAVEGALASLEEMMTAAGVAGTGSASARLAAATATARADLATATDKLERRQKVAADLAGFDEKAAVARSLWSHLKANNFEGWLLNEALAALVEGANGLLAELSRGAYSLVLEKTIDVIDHRNADERRSVRSLSGGETFLVSLALALSLGEQLLNLSERGGARLDAIFLDEGFGTLDAETLDTVAAVVAELAARGRVVGLVTHVKELAEQVPVRFEVRPGPGGSTIERVGGAV